MAEALHSGKVTHYAVVTLLDLPDVNPDLLAALNGGPLPTHKGKCVVSRGAVDLLLRLAEQHVVWTAVDHPWPCLANRSRGVMANGFKYDAEAVERVQGILKNPSASQTELGSLLDEQFLKRNIPWRICVLKVLKHRRFATADLQHTNAPGNVALDKLLVE